MAKRALHGAGLADPDPAWRWRALEELQQVRGLLEPWLDGGVHHVGSTALPAVPARPIVDLLAGVADLDVIVEAGPRLAEAGWEFVPPERDGHDWRRLYVKPAAEGMAAQLFVQRPGQPCWNAAILFRDRLRADPSLRNRFARAKRRAAADHGIDSDRYTRRKLEYLASVTGLANLPA